MHASHYLSILLPLVTGQKFAIASIGCEEQPLRHQG
jgi:hypothetical protein